MALIQNTVRYDNGDVYDSSGNYISDPNIVDWNTNKFVGGQSPREQQTQQQQTQQQQTQSTQSAQDQVNAAITAQQKIATDYINALLPQSKTITAYTGKPVYGTTQEEYDAWEKNIAIPYAESVYGKYFADQLKEYTDAASVATNRVNEDTQFALQNLQNSLNDYLSKSTTEQKRLEQDYTQARDNEAKKLGITLEALDISKTRGLEDKDRILAELQTDFETTGGRISENKARNLGRLLTDYETTTGRLTEDQSIALKNLDTNYGRVLDAKTKDMAQRRLTFSGNRIKAEQQIAEDKAREVAATNLSTERGLSDASKTYGYNKEDIIRTAEQNLADLTTNYERSTGNTNRTYERNLADIERQAKLATEQSATTQQQLAQTSGRQQEDITTGISQTTRDNQISVARQKALQERGLYDIAEELRKQQLANEQAKQAQIETGYYGVGGQYQRASENYDTQKQNYYESQGIGGYYA